MVERNAGDRSKILLNTVDVIILNLVSKRKEVFTLWLNEHLKINNKSLRNHITLLENSKFITKEQVEGTNKYLLHITPLGEKVLEIFGKIIRR
jgi:DNA-binding HxlR family transcriptional regulator